MGLELACEATIDGRKSRGRLLLETEALIFRGQPRATIRLKDLRTVRSRDGVLEVTFVGGCAEFVLGPAADKWAQKLVSPRSRTEKLGVKRDSRIAVVGVEDAGFIAELSAVTPNVHRGIRQKENDLIFFGAGSGRSLDSLGDLKSRMKSNGALWVIRPRGHKQITEAGVMAAGKAAGLVDVKVVKFSETHTAEKFVIPVKARG